MSIAGDPGETARDARVRRIFPQEHESGERMDGQDSVSPAGPYDATIDVLSAVSNGGRARPIHLVEGSGPELTSETRALLRSRLRIAALILFMGFAVFLGWSLAQLATGQPVNLAILGMHAAVVVMLGLCAGSLCRSCPISTGVLRLKELVVFGVPGAFLLVTQHVNMTTSAATREYLPNPVGVWLMLIFTYAMFIPNTWRRAAAVIGVLAVAPVLLTAMLWTTDDACAMCLEEDSWFFAQMALGMMVSAAAAVIGVHTIHRLRHEAFEAKQLGQYRLRRRLGGGGMGEVYLAEHQLMKRPCAIKVIHPEKAGDPQTLARFEREVRLSAKLSHWNNIDIFDYGRAEDGTFYYVMEYLPGLNLGELVDRFGPMPAERVIYLLDQVCGALSEAHSMGLIHRDIKPANVFAAQRGGWYDVAKLLDFGLAKPLTGSASVELTQEGTIAGSPLFMSPEQAMGDESPDPRSDIYALGALAYYLLTGHPPFDDKKPLKVLLRHMNEQPAPPSQLQPDVPEDLERVVLRCLAKRPEDRYRSAAELAEAFEQCEAAGHWTRETAAGWWREHASGQLQPVDAATA